MVLTLHIRLIFMKYCALILMNSLTTAGIAVGGLLIILLLIVSILYILKAREVATLKKTVFELRDTMRMMRYEEASLSRMLHTASKPAEQQTESEGTRAVEEESTEELIAAAPIVEKIATKEEHTDITTDEELPTEKSEETITEVSATEKELIEEPVAEDISPLEEKGGETPAAKEEEKLFSNKEAVASENAAEETAEKEIEVPSEEVEKTESSVEEKLDSVNSSAHEKSYSSAPTSQKQPINGRRPAIPTDLFSAWFAEHEESPAETEAFDKPVAEETLAEQSQPGAETLQTTPQKPLHPITEEVPAATVTNESANTTEETESPAPVPETTGNSSETELSKEDERFLRKFERVVNTRMRNPNLNVDTIAAQFGIGRTNFYRKVREVTGISPNDYLRKCRMERAAEMLRTTELSVSDVCVQVGVPDAQYFSKVFKVYFETTPTAYREKHQSIQ